MNFATYDLNQPLRYLGTGHFTSHGGWKHNYFIRKKDTELIICTKGTIYLFVDAIEYVLEKGEVLAVYPGEKIVGSRVSKNACEFVWVHFVNQGTLTFTNAYPLDQPQVTQAIIPRHFKLAHFEKMVALLEQTLDITNSRLPSRLAKDYSVSLLVSELSNDYWFQIQKTNMHENQINQIKEWIRINLYKDLKVSDITRHFHINQNYFERLFKEQTGKTVKAFINSYKIDLARYWLLTTELTIEQISDKAYFKDYKYFFRIFKQYTGTTPKKYRNSFRNTHLNNPEIDPGFSVGKAIDALEKGFDPLQVY